MQDPIAAEPPFQKTTPSYEELVVMSTENGFPPSDQKETMRRLNERLADFMAHCHHLEQSNMALHTKIEERIMRSDPQLPAWEEKERESQGLLHSIYALVVKNAKTSLEIDNYNMDLAQLQERVTTEASAKNRILEKKRVLRTMANEFAQRMCDLKIIIMDKEQEILDFNSNHQEKVQALQQLKHPIDDIQFAPEEDGSRMELSQLLNEIRRHYEALISSSSPIDHDDLPARRQLEEEEARQKMQKDDEELRAARASLYQARKQWQTLQAEIESLQAMERRLKLTLHETEQHHQKQLEALSAVIADLQQELQEVREGVRTQLQKHKMLLNTNMKLEQEISAYRNLLEAEETRLYGARQESKSSTSKIGFTLPTGATQKSAKLYRESPEQRDKNQAIFNGNIAEEGAEATGTVQKEKVDEMIRQWEGSFFKDNPKLRKKSVSLRFDLHLAAADEARPHTKKDNPPDIEVRLIMRRSCSIPTMSP